MADAKKCDRCGILYDPKDIDKYQRDRFRYHIQYVPEGKDAYAFMFDLCGGCQCMLSNFINRRPLDEDLIAHADKDYVVDYVERE